MGKHSEIDKKLLERYLGDDCSEEERRSIEEWLDEPSFGTLETPSSFKFNEEALKDEIWQSVVLHAATKKVRRRILPSFVLKYAACLLGVMWISFFYRENLTHLFFPKGDNADQLAEVIHIDKPTFITPESDSKILFVLTLDESRKLSQQISCEAGNTYLAIKVNFRSKDELLIVNKKDIHNLPPSIEGYITSQLNTI